MTSNLQMDTVIQHFLIKSLLAMPNYHEKFLFVISCIEDYIRDTKYKIWLFNEEDWKLKPSILFIIGVGSVVITCWDHNGETKDKNPYSKATQPCSSF